MSLRTVDTDSTLDVHVHTEEVGEDTGVTNLVLVRPRDAIQSRWVLTLVSGLGVGYWSSSVYPGVDFSWTTSRSTVTPNTTLRRRGRERTMEESHRPYP